MLEKEQLSVSMGTVLVSTIMIAIDLIGSLAHLTFVQWFKWTSPILLISTIIIVCSLFAVQSPDGVDFGKTFGYGVKVSTISAAILTVYMGISLTVLFPELKVQAVERARIALSRKKDLSQKAVDRALATTEGIFVPAALIGMFFSTIIIGGIGSLLGAGTAKFIMLRKV